MRGTIGDTLGEREEFAGGNSDSAKVKAAAPR